MPSDFSFPTCSGSWPRTAPLVLACIAAWGIGGGPEGAVAQERVRVPVQGEDFLLVLERETVDGAIVALLAATEGTTLVFADGARRLALPAHDASDVPEGGLATAELAGRTPERVVRLPGFRDDPAVPLPGGRDAPTPYVEVQEAHPPNGMTHDAVMGADWFHGRTWTIDYPGRAIVLREDRDLPLHSERERVPLELVRSPEGSVLPSAPVVRVGVSGTEHAAALATGSAAVLTDAAVASLADLRPALRAVTRVPAATFDAWREGHPEWHVIEGAELATGEPLLEVHDLRLADAVVERIWVLRTPESSWGAWLAAPTAAPVTILLGGDVLREFRLTLDLVGGVAIFEPGGFP